MKLRWLLTIVTVVGLTGGRAFAATKPAGNPWVFRVGGGVLTKYDDNILMLSETDKDQVDESDPNSVERFGITQPDDYIVEPWFWVTFNRVPRGGRETVITATATADQYIYNTVKNYQEYGLWVRQELNRSRAHRTALLVGGELIPDYFLRKLADEDQNVPPGPCTPTTTQCVHNAATYEKTRGYIELSQRIVDNVLSARVGYALERRDYNPDFDERDSSSDILTFDLDLYPAASLGFRIQPYYEHEEREARGDLSGSAVADDDTDFESDLYGLELRGLWGPDSDHRHSLRVFYSWEQRDFTTADASDAAHFGREDDVQRYGIYYNKELGPKWEWRASAYHRDVDINIFSGDFQKTVLSLGLGYNYDRRLRPARREGAEED